MTDTLNLVNTVAALKHYWATDSDRLALMEAAQKSGDSGAWLEAEDEALKVVRLAFYEDSKDRNSFDNCMRASVSWLSELLGVSPPGRRHRKLTNPLDVT